MRRPGPSKRLAIRAAAQYDNRMPTLAEPSHRPIIVSIAWDIILNATVPLACYLLAKRFVSPSELTALILAALFPLLKSAYDLVRHHDLNPVAVVVLLGIVISVLALYFGGDPRILLIRESLFTGAFGIACLVSLAFPRPIMFYFARYFMAGSDAQKRQIMEARLQNPVVRRAHRLVTGVWGCVYAGEFAVRTALVYTLPAAAVLAISPFMIGLATIFTILWSFSYANKVRARIAE